MRYIVDAKTGAVQLEPSEPLPLPPPEAPHTITRAQLRLWLYDHGITWDQVLTWAQAQPPGPERDRFLILLEDAVEFDRRDPRIRAAALALPLKLTEATVDAALERAWQEAATEPKSRKDAARRTRPSD